VKGVFLHLTNMSTYHRWLWPLAMAVALLWLFSDQAAAVVAGKCINCHTMHYSQDGQLLTEWGDQGPYDALLTTDCIGCHTGLNNGGTTPFVMSAIAPIYAATGTEANTNTLAGGSFYWVASGDPLKGHNVTGLTTADPFLPVPPGFDGGRAAADNSVPGNGNWPVGQQVTCAGVYGCHGTHDESGIAAAIYGGHHHGLDGALTTPDSTPATGYRLLVGIAGFEDPEWELTPTSINHNQYKGVDGGAEDSAISSLCLRCHNDFHNAGSNWFVHPINFDLGNTIVGSEVRGYGGPGNTYQITVPVASFDVGSPIGEVSFQDDTIISCVTCHRSHGSPYDKLLRWDYVNTNDGCTVCHTSKD
jgi:predicted CXXCH cytochrome family protein